MSAEKNKGILLEDDVDDFETISHSPDKSYHRKSQQHSFEIIEPKHLESDHKYHGSNNVTQYFGSESGLFSKFTGMRNVSEEHRPHGSPTKEQMREEEERESLTLSERNKQNVGRNVSQGIENSSNNNKFGYKLAILTVIFSIQFASSVEMVYITPYFIKLALSDWVDTTFWMIPVIVTTLLTPLVSIMVKHNTYQRAVQIGFMIVSLIGCFLFAYIDELVHYFAVNYEKRIITLTWMGLVAFCLIDVSNEMILLTQNKIIDESLQPDNSIANQADVASSLGKIFGFFFGSLQALQFDFYKILQNNMDFCFFAAGVLMAISLLLICLFHPTIPVSSREPTVSLKHLQLVHFLPISNKFKTASLRMKTLIAAHFFGASTILMLSVYTTSWVGQDVLRGDPDRPAHTLENRLFDLGVSWGSFALMLTSVVVMFTGFVINRMANKPNKPVLKGFFILSQLLAAIGLLDCVFIHDYSDVFVVLPLTGFAFQTFQIIPELIGDILEKREKGSVTGDYKQLLSLNLFYAQALTFVFIPFIFLLFPDISDNLWGILVAGAGGVISAVFALFV